MASINPELELRRRQLARLRAAYDAGPRPANDAIETSIAQHSRVLLGRILIALSDPRSGTNASESRTDGKICADA